MTNISPADKQKLHEDMMADLAIPPYDYDSEKIMARNKRAEVRLSYLDHLDWQEERKEEWRKKHDANSNNAALANEEEAGDGN